MTLNYDSVSTITELLKEKNIALKKRWGQNFLVNRGAREKLISCLEPLPGELVWEIGPGLGAMTALLLEKQVKLVVFEIDRGLIACLRTLFPATDTFSIVEGDILRSWEEAVRHWGVPRKILGNLPYASASAIVAAFISGGLLPAKMVFTVQKELALRMTARPGSKNYSSFSVFCRFAFDVRIRGELNPGSFFPVPDVVSTIIEMVPATKYPQPGDGGLFFELIRCAFHARRKTLRNNLLHTSLAGRCGRELICAALEKEGIRGDMRGETLDIEDFIRLADTIKKLTEGGSEWKNG